jgi:hypothetical protein
MTESDSKQSTAKALDDLRRLATTQNTLWLLHEGYITEQQAAVLLKKAREQ